MLATVEIRLGNAVLVGLALTPYFRRLGGSSRPPEPKEVPNWIHWRAGKAGLVSVANPDSALNPTNRGGLLGFSQSGLAEKPESALAPVALK